MVATEVWQPQWQHHTQSLLSLVVTQITHSPFAIATNMHGAFTKQSLRSVGILAMVLSSLNWLASGQIIHASHKLVQGTIYGNIICCRWSGRPVVAGDQLWHDRSTWRHGVILDSSVPLILLKVIPIVISCRSNQDQNNLLPKMANSSTETWNLQEGSWYT